MLSVVYMHYLRGCGVCVLQCILLPQKVAAEAEAQGGTAEGIAENAEHVEQGFSLDPKTRVYSGFSANFTSEEK